MTKHSINSVHLLETLGFFRDSIARIAAEQSMPTDKVADLGVRYAMFVSTNLVAIAEDVVTDLAYYLNFYDIYPENDVYDEFKNFYFFGVGIAKELEMKGSSELAKLQLLATQFLLDIRLDKVGARRPGLTERLKSAIEKGAVLKDFGRIGWYITYKCLYNEAREHPRAKSL